MTTIAIVPESDATGTKTYRAVTGTRQCTAPIITVSTATHPNPSSTLPLR
jgi:hypothetical protein